MREIKKDAFCECSRLTKVVIPEGLIKIGDFAFLSCNRLKNISLPKSLTEISHTAMPDNITISAPVGSYAEQYAKEHNIPFVAE